MIGIIGGGFGLYGWLPAVCQYYPDKTILIEQRHRSKFNRRPELQKYVDRIRWFSSTEQIIYLSETLILAIPPDQTYDYLDFIVSHSKVTNLIIEKPICETPEKSEEFINEVEKAGIKICSSYLFIYTDWFKNLNPNNQYTITWIKSNDNPKDSWKHKEELGGGQMFYNIHLLALKSYLNNIKTNFIHMFSPDYNIINIRDKTNNTEISTSPFSEITNGEDSRVTYIKELLYDFENNYEKVNKLMHKTNQLWKTVENKINIS